MNKYLPSIQPIQHKLHPLQLEVSPNVPQPTATAVAFQVPYWMTLTRGHVISTAWAVIAL